MNHRVGKVWIVTTTIGVPDNKALREFACLGLGWLLPVNGGDHPKLMVNLLHRVPAGRQHIAVGDK